MKYKYKLSIIIPMYNETEEVVKPMLDSIALQQNIDFNDIEVVIVNDGGSYFLSEDFLKSYKFTINYYTKDHAGVSAARNYGLDKAQGEYVCFNDCDDMYYNMCGLWILFREMNNGVFDSLVSVFIEETRDQQKNVQYINHEMDTTFVHGKVHRKQYLIDKNIRWNEALTIHEDSYFNILCQNLSQNVKYCHTPFYLWKWRDDSVCRSDFKYILRTYNNMLDSSDALVDEFLRRGMTKQANFYTIFMIFDAYYTMNKTEWINQENKEYRNKTEKRFKDYFLKHEKIWKDVSLQEKMQISNGVRSRSVREGMEMEKMTIDSWLKHIKKL